MQKSTFFLTQNSTNSPDCFASTYYEKVSIQIVQKFKRRKLETETLNNNYTVFSVRNSKREVPRYEVPQMSQMYCSRNYANSSFTKFTIFILHEVNTKFSWCWQIKQSCQVFFCLCVVTKVQQLTYRIISVQSRQKKVFLKSESF